MRKSSIQLLKLEIFYYLGSIFVNVIFFYLEKRTANLPAKLQRSVTGSKYDHVALVLNIDGVIHVLDSQYENAKNIF